MIYTSPPPPALTAITATFSIVAADPETGICGAAVASKYPGTRVLAISAQTGTGVDQWLDAVLSEHFGHCDIFTLVDVEGDQLKVTTLANGGHEQGGCLAPVMLLKGAGVDVMVAGRPRCAAAAGTTAAVAAAAATDPVPAGHPWAQSMITSLICSRFMPPGYAYEVHSK